MFARVEGFSLMAPLFVTKMEAKPTSFARFHCSALASIEVEAQGLATRSWYTAIREVELLLV